MRVVIVVLAVAGLSFLAPRRLRLPLWVLAILVGVVPWWGFQDHPHWGRVGWWPFLSPPVRLRDVVVNVILYLPFGYHAGGGRWRWTSVVLAGAALSLATEFSQVYSHGRFPTATDVVTNTAGAALGAWLAERRRANTGPGAARGR